MTWAIISPVFLLVIFLVGVISWEEHKYSGIVPYPEWATWIGWGLVGISAVQIPLWAVLMTIYYLIKGRPSQVHSQLYDCLINPLYLLEQVNLKFTSNI